MAAKADTTDFLTHGDLVLTCVPRSSCYHSFWVDSGSFITARMNLSFFLSQNLPFPHHLSDSILTCIRLTLLHKKKFYVSPQNLHGFHMHSLSYPPPPPAWYMFALCETNLWNIFQMHMAFRCTSQPPKCNARYILICW